MSTSSAGLPQQNGRVHTSQPIVILSLCFKSIYTSSAVITRQVFLSSSHLPRQVCLEKPGRWVAKKCPVYTDSVHYMQYRVRVLNTWLRKLRRQFNLKSTVLKGFRHDLKIQCNLHFHTVASSGGWSFCLSARGHGLNSYPTHIPPSSICISQLFSWPPFGHSAGF